MKNKTSHNVINHNLATTIGLMFLISTLMLTLFETTKNVHAENYKRIGNSIHRAAGRAPAIETNNKKYDFRTKTYTGGN